LEDEEIGDLEANSELIPLMGSIHDTVFPPGVVAHDTKVLQDVIWEVGGIKACIYLLELPHTTLHFTSIHYHFHFGGPHHTNTAQSVDCIGMLRVMYK